MKIYYHKGSGDVVTPTSAPVKYHLDQLQVVAKCSHEEPIGWLEGYEERKECWGIVNATDEQHWKPVDHSEYRVCPPDRRRLYLTKKQPAEQEVGEKEFRLSNRMDLMSDAEKAISSAIGEVEKSGASENLTNAVILLGKARGFVYEHYKKLSNDKTQSRK